MIKMAKKSNPKNKKAIFICQFTESSLKLVKCLIKNNFTREFVELTALPLTPNLDDKSLTAKLKQAFSELKHNNNAVILSLPRQQATCRYIKIPTQSSQEIEKIISFQASKYLPYPVNELLSGYQIVSIDKQGYSHVNLNIVHRRVVEKYLGILGAAGIKDIRVTLSSYGISNLYAELNPKESEVTLVADIDIMQVELAIVLKDKLYFSRSFRVGPKDNLESLLFEEITKTSNTYIKETGAKAFSRIFILNNKENMQHIAKALNDRMNIPATALSYWERISCSRGFSAELLRTNGSFASLVGLGLKDLPDSINIVPQDIKEMRRKRNLHLRYLRLSLFSFITIIIFSLAVVKNMDNKNKYLIRLKKELSKISPQAKSLEELERRINILETYGQKKPSLLDIVSELHRLTPASLSLVNFSYEENGEIALRGQAPDLNSVFLLVSELEKSAAFSSFKVKVEYATKRKAQSGEFIDFEISCLKD